MVKPSAKTLNRNLVDKVAPPLAHVFSDSPTKDKQHGQERCQILSVMPSPSPVAEVVAPPLVGSSTERERRQRPILEGSH